jgi:hypothetical protein
MDNTAHAPMEMMHKKVVRDITKAIDHTYYGASIEDVSYSEEIIDDMDIISTIHINGANGSHFKAQEKNLPEYEMLEWVMHQFLRFLREESL